MVRESRISAGSFDLNKFLFGGFETDIISTIYGPGASGKSNLCMIVAVSQAKKGNKVIYVDTEGGFSIDRFRQVHGGEKGVVERDLGNVMLLKPTSFDEQKESIEKLLLHVSKQSVSLVIVDSLTMLYRLVLGEAISQKDPDAISFINRQLAKQLRSLNEVARKQNIPVIVTNQVYTSFSRDSEVKNSEVDRQINMVGGDLLKYWSKCLIELSIVRGKRRLVLKKHRSLPVKEMFFDIVTRGIKKKSSLF